MHIRLLSRRLACIFPDDSPGEGAAAGTGGGGASGGQSPAGDQGGEDRGFPADTPIAEMTDAQQAAYWKHQARKHEGVVKGLGNIDELKTKAAEADRLRQERLSTEEKALQEAEQRGRQAATAELQPRLVETTFRGVAGQRQLPAEQIDTLWEGVNPKAFLTDTGEVDTDKVTRYLSAITPMQDPTVGLYRTGAGHQEQIKQTGREAGLAEAQKRFGTTTS
ncbi:hypothetical protein [Cellulomonas iranensis]|uniref:hypothetical protein n=1 Tax=Cellulomonas iranensis TaxID=76862 RepID=UPI0013D53442|nr:hypothetical protein [Cellulomonas iranensis]